jgi:hypothetical protein
MADLLASFWTLAGDLDVTSPAASPWPFARRVAAAAAAGYRGFGVDARDVLGRGRRPRPLIPAAGKDWCPGVPRRGMLGTCGS